MKAEAIMQSNLLDIVFENRNKAYGAYTLRKFYANRLYRAIAGTLSLALIFSIWFTLFGKQHKVVPDYIPGPIVLIDPAISDPVTPAEKKVKPMVKASTGGPKNVQQIQSVIPLIVKDTLSVTNMPTITDIDKSVIGKATIAGVTDAGLTGIGPGKDKGTIGGGTFGKQGDNNPDVILNKVEQMPEFPGGREALVKYLLRNIQNPDDLDGADKLVVIAEFVVNKLGEIENVTIAQHSREDLEQDIMKVIRKMPRWKPGIQNGKNVSVYYSLPITFVPGG